METPFYKLGLAMATAVFMPALTYALGVAWLRVVGARELERTWRMICVLLPIVALGTMVAIRSDIIRGAYEESPILAGVIYSFIGIVVPFGLIAAAIRLWRTPDR
jgi:hypothetical protein